jgi:hypothetical protein
MKMKIKTIVMKSKAIVKRRHKNLKRMDFEHLPWMQPRFARGDAHASAVIKN